ncbi:MAG: rhodanese-like domain-containing protein [Pseudomonadota bacterium]
MNAIVRGLAALIGLTLLATGALAQDWKKLITPGELEAIKSRVLILDIRLARGDKTYNKGHIAGSVSAPYPLWRGPRNNPGQPLSDDALTMLLRTKGVTKAQPVVVAYQGANPTDFGAAARVYWTLKSAGVERIAILNGGIENWVRRGFDLTDEAAAPNPSQITASLSPQWMASKKDIRAITSGRIDGTLVDARPNAFLKGKKKHPAAKAAGTLKGATQFVHSDWFAGDRGGLPPVNGLLDKYRKPEGSGPIVSFCNTGHWAATNWFMMSEIQGLPDVKLYPESMVGWTNDGGRVVTQ